MPKEKGLRSEAASRLRQGSEFPPGPAGDPVPGGNPKEAGKKVLASTDERVRAKRLEEYDKLPKRRAPHDESDDSALLRSYQNRSRGE